MEAYISEEELEKAKGLLGALQQELGQVLFGQEALINQLIVALLSGGHVLLEGLPGLGKTELIKGLGKALALHVSRIQFTPDLLPGDITGNPILQEQNGSRTFVFQRGPIFTNLLLADEINRASPKTQSALLEAMQEKRVTVAGTTHGLPRPFFVLATQNPIELEGTYPLPEAQLDRFLFKIDVHPGSLEVLEKIVTHREIGVEPEVNQVLSCEDFVWLMERVRHVYLPEIVTNYIARLVYATHQGNSETASRIKYGASPRAALALSAGARAQALLEGRMNSSFEDVAKNAHAVLKHRLVLEYSTKLDGLGPADVVDQLLEEISFQARVMASTLVSDAT